MPRPTQERPAGVTTELGEQVREALQILLAGFEAAGDDALDEALRHDGARVYEGLLTVLLRLIFVVYAEDRDLLPARNPVYAGRLGLRGLHAALLADADAYADTMDRRFGAWPRLLALFRALHFGREHSGESTDNRLSIPALRGRLFDPERHPFLEGRMPAGVSAVGHPEGRLPGISDGVVLRVLERLLVVGGQAIRYGALAEEQLGGVYENLMGHAIERRAEPSICLAGSRVWVGAGELLRSPRTTRARWLQDAGVTAGAARRLAAAVDALEDAHGPGPGLDAAVLAALREFSGASRRGKRRADEVLAAEVGAGRLVIQPGEQRRRTSSHYTPRSLSGPIVRRTLEPLLAALRARLARERPDLGDPRPGAGDLLSLRICDPAMGSGAFLVEACRFMAAEVVAAWARGGVLERELAAAGDDASREPELLARRLVARRCLFGVDKNPLAVELGKLSLWLLTGSRGQDLGFLDHRLKCGDSLVGLTRAQVLRLDWSADGEAEAGLTDDSDDLDLGRLRAVADILLSSYFFPRERPAALCPQFLLRGERVTDRERRACLARLRDELADWLRGPASAPLPGPLELRRALVRDTLRPMHWEIEFPELFPDRHGDLRTADGIGRAWVDAVVGNPPFSGKNGIADRNGPAYLTWLTSAYTPSHGNSDLAAYFFRRADWLLGGHGTIGLIATNTIGQGDTRGTGLQPIVASGGRIYEAVRDLQWPVRGASVSVSIVHLARGAAYGPGLRVRLDGEEVAAINSQLRPGPERLDPARLAANQGRSFQGSIVLGKGFVLTPAERDALIAEDPRNHARISPYMGGQELNASRDQAHDRYVIDFVDLGLAEAQAWPALLEIVRDRVKPERDRAAHSKGPWWLFERRRGALYEALRGLDRCIACSSVSKYAVFAFQPIDRVFAHSLIVFPLASYAQFGVLQSRVHGHWARVHGSTLEDRLRYTPSDCFETFPFPDEATLAPDAALEAVAGRLHAARAAYMIASDQGLTRAYNALTDPANDEPEVRQLRRLHEQLDRAVLDAYGQPGILVPPYAGAAPGQLERFEGEVLEFLYARNTALARREAAAAGRVLR